MSHYDCKYCGNMIHDDICEAEKLYRIEESKRNPLNDLLTSTRNNFREKSPIYNQINKINQEIKNFEELKNTLWDDYFLAEEQEIKNKVDDFVKNGGYNWSRY